VTTPLRVVICDDSLGFPALLRAWLNDDGRFTVVGTASGGEQAKTLVAEHRPDLLVLDLLLPDAPDPASLVAALRGLHPPLRIMLISSLRPTDLRPAGRAAGADGVCGKGATQQVLAATLFAIASGGAAEAQV
jgi:DNA-binding NarL/FixJ family response regulator